ncbi:phosphoribosyltransferase [Legionella israelensis]|uniref:Phosphoribosyltransferase n=1 Tax=Legionella israelensis TaxID=454 RepID=A0AAX1EI93_9GAMM|nr:phosphoribosyltransferase [Legionella israelensis]QBR84911.1 phosphoribosyltransferase [Legionella israelensis]
MERFADRYAAGKLLAKECKPYANRPDTLILALPRGGVPVAYEMAKSLSLPLDVFVVRKLGMPGYEELAIGAIASGDVTVFNQNILNQFNLSQAAIDNVIEKEKAELNRREKTYRGKKSPLDLKDKIIILVDDGIATGATVKAAIKAIRWQKPQKLVLAIPVAALSSYEEMKTLVDEVVCLMRPEYFNAVGLWYEDFSQTSDEEVFQLLKDNDIPSANES